MKHMVTREETYSKAFELKKKALKEKERRYNMMLDSAYAENPRIKELENEQASVGAELVLASLSDNERAAALREHLKAITAEKKLLLEKAGVENIVYDCQMCRDTGYVSGKICDCVKKAAAGIMIAELSKEMPILSSRFDNFDLKYYKDTDTREGNPRRRMTAILKTCKEYVLHFDPHKSPNLLFMGSAGLGKTHLTLAVVAGVAEKGFVPVYGSAENLFAQLEKEKFSSENRGAYDMMTGCDLLVIDDLGAEMVTSFSKSALYNLINTRMLSGRPTIINTNLSMKEIETRYTPRISSRLIGNYDAYRFLGDDIRQQKAIERANG